MCGARRRGKLCSAAAWLFFLLLHLLAFAISQEAASSFDRPKHAGDQERLVRAEDASASRPSPAGTSLGRGGEEQRLSRVGSRPPCCVCQRRCGGCAPCTAVQVRAGVGVVRPLCANYEPVRWKCRCGGAVFDP